MSLSIPNSTLEKFTTFGDLLRFLRRRVSITQLELATEVGYSDGQISRLEQNLRLPDMPTIEARFVPALGLEEEPKAVARLLALAANVRREDAPALGLCPYKGLNYFDEADSILFAGREALTAKLTERVLALASSGSIHERRFLAIVGASGSGKSSLVRAGVVPALRWNKDSADWIIHTIIPTAHPLEGLASSLLNSVATVTTLMDDLARDPRGLSLFAKRTMQPGNGSHLLLVVDQFEELFTLCHSEEERASFIDNLLMASSESAGPMIILITLRADFYAHCAGYLQLREALAQQQEYIGVMSDPELQRAIEEPARLGRWEFEPGLVELLLREVGHEPGALPLLSHALLETWQRRRGRTMTLSGYTSSGGVRGAIAETAESVFTDQFTREQQLIARRIFLRLTELGDETDTGDTRRRAAFTELILKPEEAASTQAVLQALTNARLITTSEDFAEVAHEALIREWPTLRAWLEENRESLRFHQHLTETSQEWAASNREPGLLYRGVRLTQVREWAVIHADEMNDLEREFIDTSHASAEREVADRESQRERELQAAQKLAEEQRQRAEEQSRAARQSRRGAVYLIGALMLMVIAALTAGIVANRNSTLAAQNAAVAVMRSADFARAEQQARLAMSREWAAAAVGNIGVDSDRSILLALQAVSVTHSVDKSWTREAEEALHQAVSAQQSYLSLRGHASGVNDVAFSPDGTLIATASLDGTAKIWDSTTAKELLTLYPDAADAGKLYSVIFSPAGKQVATAGEAGVVSLWDSTTGEQLLTLLGNGEPSPIFSLSFSPDGARLATASRDGTVRVWELATSQVSLEVSIDLTLPPDTFTIFNVHDVIFSPDGTRLATVGPHNTAKVWDAVTGEELLTLAGHQEAILALAYRPDGSRIATASYDATTKIWDAATGAELLTLSGNVSRHTGVVFSPDGTRLAIVSDDGTAKVWDASGDQQLFTLAGHTSAVRAVTFSPDGTRIATASDDATVRIWQAAPSRELFTLTGHTQAIYGGHFSPDGTRLLTSSNDGTVKVWNVLNGQLLYTLALPTGDAIQGGAFTPNGKFIATGAGPGDRLVRIWDVATGELSRTFRGHTAGVFEVKFSPDGTQMASAGSKEKTVKLWAIATGKELFTLSGHEGRVFWLDFSPDGKRLISGGEDGVAIVWDLANGKPLFKLPISTGVNFGVSYSPDGTRLLTTDSSEVAKAWDATTGQLLMELSGHTGPVYGAAWSPDGTRIATASADKTVKLWDAASGEDLLTLYGHSAVVGGVAFSPDGMRLMTMSDDGTARIYTLSIEDLIALAKTRVTRSLTTQECQQYMHVATCPSEP
jgi:WD40 repeat protein/transcriptional regulator with XRE-family HTH domain